MSTTRTLLVAHMLLLIAQVTCDWVEIEQDHYKPHRKPTINNNLRTKNSNEDPQLERTTKVSTIEKEHIEDKKWSKGVVDRVTNVGNLRRVQTPSVQTTGIKHDYAGPVFRKNIPDMNEADRSKFRDHIITPNRHFFTERPNVISLRSSQSNKDIKPIQDNLDDVKSASYDLKKYEEKDTTVSNNRFNNNKIYQMQILKEQPLKSEDIKTIAQKESNENDFDDNFEIIKFGYTRTSPRPNIFETHASTTNKMKIFHREQTAQQQVMQNFNHENIKYPNSSVTKPIAHSRITNIDIASEQPTSFKVLHSYPPKILETENNNPLERNKDEQLPAEPQSKTTEGASKDKNEKKMDGMLKLIKVVSDIIYKNTHRSFNGKVMYLEGLKSTLLTTIEDYIEKLWPDDVGRSRQVREARGHLEFPSSESALMTISFLTFAVFLIKLVLQVIHTYKNKTMTVTPTLVAAVGRVAKAMRSQQSYSK